MATKTNKNSNSVIEIMHNNMNEAIKLANKTKGYDISDFYLWTVKFAKNFEQKVRNYIKEQKLAECLQDKLGFIDCHFVSFWLYDETNIKGWLKDEINKFMSMYEEEIALESFNVERFKQFATAIFEEELNFELS